MPKIKPEPKVWRKLATSKKTSKLPIKTGMLGLKDQKSDLRPAAPQETAADFSVSTVGFLSLPPEVRRKVFECVFYGLRITIRCQQPRTCVRDRVAWKQERSRHRYHHFNFMDIMYLTKQLRAEATTVFLEIVAFDFSRIHPWKTAYGLVKAKKDYKPSPELLTNFKECLGRIRRIEGPVLDEYIFNPPWHTGHCMHNADWAERWMFKPQLRELTIYTVLDKRALIDPDIEKCAAHFPKLRQFVQSVPLAVQGKGVIAVRESGGNPWDLLFEMHLVGTETAACRVLSCKLPKADAKALVRKISQALGLRFSIMSDEDIEQQDTRKLAIMKMRTMENTYYVPICRPV